MKVTRIIVMRLIICSHRCRLYGENTGKTLLGWFYNNSHFLFLINKSFLLSSRIIAFVRFFKRFDFKIYILYILYLKLCTGYSYILGVHCVFDHFWECNIGTCVMFIDYLRIQNVNRNDLFVSLYKKKILSEWSCNN